MNSLRVGSQKARHRIQPGIAAKLSLLAFSRKQRPLANNDVEEEDDPCLKYMKIE